MKHDVLCDLRAPGPHEPDCGCRRRRDRAEAGALRGEIEQLRAENEQLSKDVNWWRKHAIERDPLLGIVKVGEEAGLYGESPTCPACGEPLTNIGQGQAPEGHVMWRCQFSGCLSGHEEARRRVDIRLV